MNEKTKKRKFAFLIHPREGKDLGRLLGKKTRLGEEAGVRLIPKLAARLVLKLMRTLGGPVVCSRFDVSDSVEGHIVGLPMTAREMLALPRKYVARQITETVLFCQNRLGVERVGLGAYTAPLSLNGVAVIRDKRVTCAITHGDALSAASAVPTVQQAAALRGIDLRQSTLAVVGGYGLMGRAVAIMLSEQEPAGIILTGPNHRKLEKVEGEISGFQGEVICSSDNGSVRDADILVLCTSAAGNVVEPGMLKKGAVVVDMAQPHNMGPDVCRARPDVLRVDGGFMAVPGVDIGFCMGPPAGTTYACLTETMVSTLAGDREHHVGPVDMDFARKILGRALDFGFTPAPLSNFSNPVPGSRKTVSPSPERPGITFTPGGNMAAQLQYIRRFVDRGGPQPSEYEELNHWFGFMRDRVQSGVMTGTELQELWDQGGEPFSPRTMQGLVRAQSNGYAGDYQVIDRIYRNWISPEPHLATWDRFFHWQKATRAVRNRKNFFHNLLREFEAAGSGNDDLRLFNLGSGPGRDIHEYLQRHPDSRWMFDCLDNDPGAVRFARTLCGDHLDRTWFHCGNVLRFKTTEKYHLIWAGGLFDYFNDRTFVFMLKRLAAMLAPNGELVIGNFSEDNPSRGYMECGNWFLHHRSEDHLVSLARECDIPPQHVRVDMEPEGVNLFLHVSLATVRSRESSK